MIVLAPQVVLQVVHTELHKDQSIYSITHYVLQPGVLQKMDVLYKKCKWKAFLVLTKQCTLPW